MADLNAIVIAFQGRCKMIAYEQHGISPFGAADDDQKQTAAAQTRRPGQYVDPKTLPPLTPAAFDAMFPGRPSRGEQPKLAKPGA